MTRLCIHISTLVPEEYIIKANHLSCFLILMEHPIGMSVSTLHHLPTPNVTIKLLQDLRKVTLTAVFPCRKRSIGDLAK